MPHGDLVSNNLKNPDYCSVFGPSATVVVDTECYQLGIGWCPSQDRCHVKIARHSCNSMAMQVQVEVEEEGEGEGGGNI